MITAFYVPPQAKEAESLTDTAQILEAFRKKEGVLWVDFERPTPEETNLLADEFQFHPVAVQACREVTSQPLIHTYGDYLFMVMHAVDMQESMADVGTLEVDIFWGKHFVLTYHTDAIHSITDFRTNRSTGAAVVLSRGVDFFVHAVVDRMVDNFTAALDRIGVRLEELEIRIFRKPSDTILRELLDLRTTVGYLARIALSERDVVGRIVRGEFTQLTKQALAYWYEAYDHLVRMVQMIEAHRDLINTVRDTYMSVITHRTNEILKVMTIIATVFMPVTFIASIYGMNFKNMPEIAWRHGYAFTWGLMAVVTIGMLWFFRRKRWI